MKRLNKNILANYGGQFAAAVTGFLVIPFYIRHLGPAGYGLVSFFLSMQSLLVILDLGMSTSASREISRVTASEHAAGGARNLLRTLELFYAGLTVLICAGLAACSSWIATAWIQAPTFDPKDIQTCVLLTAGTISLRFPVALYQGFFRGMERQVRLNLIFSSIAVTKGHGSVAVLAFVSPTVTAFYKWQLLEQVVEVGILALGAWGTIGGVRGPARLDFSLLKPVWRFAMSVAGISILAIFMKQADKLIISRMLPIEYVGFYATAGLASGGIIKVYQPIYSAIFPRFSKLIAQKNLAGVELIFRQYSQLVAFLAAPAAAILICFPEQILLFWTRSALVAEQGSAALSFLTVNMLCAALLTVPNALLLASGNTRLPLCNNAIITVAIIPGVIVGILHSGLAGAAFCWLLAGALSYIFLPQLMFRHILSAECRRWYFKDTLPLVLAGLALFQGINWIAPPRSGSQLLISIVFGCAFYLAFAFWRFPGIRAFIQRTSPDGAIEARVRASAMGDL